MAAYVTMRADEQKLTHAYATTGDPQTVQVEIGRLVAEAAAFGEAEIALHTDTEAGLEITARYKAPDGINQRIVVTRWDGVRFNRYD